MSSQVPPPRNVLLAAEIRRVIEQAGGRITFRDFMELALYHPLYGYYMSAGVKTGKSGDYLTSPELTPLFGRTIGRFLARHSIKNVLEFGAGAGGLTAALADTFTCSIVERSDDFRQRQRLRLPAVTWLSEVPEGFEGAVLTNEILDALPVHRVFKDREIYVRSNFGEELDAYSTPELDRYFEKLGVRPSGSAEVNLDACALMSSIFQRLARGLTLTIDYGLEAPDLYEKRLGGTFRTYRRHQLAHDPYKEVGEVDMTSHVDFTTLMLLGEQHGFRTVLFTTQADFLAAEGIGELLVAVAADPDYPLHRQAVMELLNPAGMGSFRVLVQQK